MSNHQAGPPGPAIVEMRGITISFPGVLALDDVDFSLRSGEIHALMGENGAGKSTLIKALTGVYAIDSGDITVAGQPRGLPNHRRRAGAGISTVYQEVNLCPNLTVGENVMLGHEPRRGRRIDWKGVHEQAAEHLRSLGLEIDTRTMLSSHSLAIQQLVAISRAMVLDSRVSDPRRAHVQLGPRRGRAALRSHPGASGHGCGILFVSHFLEQVYEISDCVTVLRNGRLVGEYLIGDLPRQDLVTKMIGRELDDLEAISAASNREIDRTGVPVLKATDVGRRGVLEPADLEVFEGEVVGLAGLLGSGRTELVRLLYGADRADSGSISINGEPAKDRHRRATRSRIGSCSPPRIVAGRASSPTSRSRRTSCWESRPAVAGGTSSASPSATPSSPSTSRPST